MTDIEKVIKGLECAIGTRGIKTCDDCPYENDFNCIGCDIVMRDALALLKDHDRIKVTRCKDCRYFEPSNAEEGDCSGYCRNDYVPCQNQTVDAWWFCGSAERG